MFYLDIRNSTDYFMTNLILFIIFQEEVA